MTKNLTTNDNSALIVKKDLCNEKKFECLAILANDRPFWSESVRSE